MESIRWPGIVCRQQPRRTAIICAEESQQTSVTSAGGGERERERGRGDAASVSCSRQRTAAVPVTVAAVLYCSSKAFSFSLQPTKGAEDDETATCTFPSGNANWRGTQTLSVCASEVLSLLSLGFLFLPTEWILPDSGGAMGLGVRGARTAFLCLWRLFLLLCGIWSVCSQTTGDGKSLYFWETGIRLFPQVPWWMSVGYEGSRCPLSVQSCIVISFIIWCDEWGQVEVFTLTSKQLCEECLIYFSSS